MPLISFIFSPIQPLTYYFMKVVIIKRGNIGDGGEGGKYIGGICGGE
jgi:hypothetical protein